MNKIKANLFVPVTLVMLLTLSLGSIAQRNMKGPKGSDMERFDDKPGIPPIPDLTEEQEANIKNLHVKMMQEALPIRNEIKEKEAKLNSLQTAEKVNMNEINKTIDEISVLKAKLQKKRAATHQEVRKLLTDEQRIFFDTHKGRHAKGLRENRPGRAYHQGKRNGDCPNNRGRF